MSAYIIKIIEREESKMIGIIRSSKSIGGNGVAFGEDAVSSGSSLGPDPASANVIVVEIAPKVILSSGGLGPVPGLFDFQVRTVHVGHVPSVSELCEFGAGAEGVLAHVVSSGVASHVKSADRISEGDDAAGPALVEGLIGVAVGSEIRVVVIERPGEHFRVDDAGDGQLDSAGGVSELRVATVAGHPAHETVLLLRPDCCLECESFLNHRPRPVIRVVLRERVGRSGACEGDC